MEVSLLDVSLLDGRVSFSPHSQAPISYPDEVTLGEQHGDPPARLSAPRELDRQGCFWGAILPGRHSVGKRGNPWVGNLRRAVRAS